MERYKLTIPFIDEEGERFIEATDLRIGITYEFYESEYKALNYLETIRVKRFVLKRMHLIRAGVYDDENTQRTLG
ncbi:hypothetical protein BN997_01147 [Oceanobacillus oncorhynchi]|uniref:Uncharacterized protein n=1 Tax=Oceanobacillus oncorhynchi TaxID=545501 RepID=A0A0A1MNJ5_9BACI|nr:hypothetical protein [Oceanobacillus oncorhynchi]CEI81329.1 hypothetical protein BN997_01147 [Oceanobacillus oncorhynchi]